MEITRKKITNNTAFKANTLQVKQLSVADSNIPVKAGNQINTQLISSALQAQTLPRLGYKKISEFKPPYYDKAQIYKLDNGQKVVILNAPGKPFEVKTFVKVGSFNEDDAFKKDKNNNPLSNRGISHYIEHNLFNGSNELKSGELVKEVNKMGGKYNASTGTYQTDYFIISPIQKQEYIDNVLQMHANMLHFPTFSQKTLDKEKGIVISEIHMYEDSPYDKAFNTLLKNLFNIKTPYQGLVAGADKNIRDLTQEDVRNFYNKWYTPDNMTTVIVGDVDSEKTIQHVSKYMNAKKSIPSNMDDFINKTQKHYQELKPIDKTIRTDIADSNVDSVVLYMGFSGPKNKNYKETLAVSGLCCALTGFENARLNKDLKPFNADPMVDRNVVSPNLNDPQALSVSVNFMPGEEEKGLKQIYSTLFSMSQKPISDKELAIVKNKLKDAVNKVSERSSGLVNLIGDALISHGDIKAYTQMPELIEGLTAQDIQNAAKKYLNLNKAAVVMIHPDQDNIADNAGNDNKQTVQPKPVSFAGSIGSLHFDNIKEKDLKNNFHLALNNDKNTIRTSSIMEFKANSLPKTKPGVTEILGLMMSKGTKLHDEDTLNEIIDANNLGIIINTGVDNIAVEADCPDENLGLATDIMNEMLLNPLFNEENFKKSKDELKVELSSATKDPGSRALETLYPNDSYGFSQRKILESIDNITLDDVKNLYSTIINNSQGRAVITGPLDSDKNEINIVENKIATQLPTVSPYKYEKNYKNTQLDKTKVITEAVNRNQAHIIELYKVDVDSEADYIALKVLNEILGGNSQSRLFQDLRETQKMAPYKVRSYCDHDGQTGNLMLDVKVDTRNMENGKIKPLYENLKGTLDGYKRHVNDLKTKPVSQEELEAAKLNIKSNIILGAQSSIGKTALIKNGLNSPYGANEIPRLLKYIDELKPEDIMKAANKHFANPSVISVLASKDTIDNSKAYLESLGDYKAY